MRKRGRAGVTDRHRFLSLHPLCLHCEQKGRVAAAREVDHIIPLHQGGSDEDDNKQALCSPCHQAKTAKDLGYIQKGADINGVPLSPDHHWNTDA